MKTTIPTITSGEFALTTLISMLLRRSYLGWHKTAFASGMLRSETEFHASDIYHRKKNFKNWNDFDRRMDILVRLSEILSMEEVLLIDIQINCSLLYENQRADQIAFMYLCERANDLVKAKKGLGMLKSVTEKTTEWQNVFLQHYRIIA